ncbi:1-acyl-sn-glycerol-3-phosphate acyltransferase [Novosphingobium sp. TH158]|uniref:lysophospholipid acyltransferase family protein n=1 Tax=Novosphingobium sp. TH158 TaxID=2067455 RepID=UPI000C7B930E|nr:1-acyl-sn-glycerol-3-phosphate acyltransferase [Novosphingobium sp. TH158]PLK26530.1 1-acyl-sn-glycerol-3-phosphate acyltransferase [Novosphingobium sp. TH158]
MTALAQAPRRRFGPFGLIRIVIRIMAMLGLLLACLPPYYLFALLRLHNPWPRLFLAGIGWIAGVNLRVIGERPRGGAFLISNHVSWIDIPAIARATGSAFVGHDGLASTPLLKHLCAMNDTVFIARHDRASVHRQVEDVRRAIRDTGALTIFPEGTTSDGTGLLPFKSSLLSALEPVPDGVSVIPVLLDFGREAADIAWVGDEHGVDNFLRILARRRPVQLTVHFLPPLAGEAVKDRKAMASAAREALLAAMN